VDALADGLAPRTFQGRLTLALVAVVAVTLGLVGLLVVNRLGAYFDQQQQASADQDEPTPNVTPGSLETLGLTLEQNPDGDGVRVAGVTEDSPAADRGLEVGDIIVAEPGALIRFSGERVTSGTVGEKLPVGFGKAEFLLERGFIDQIVPRPQLRERLALFLTAFRAASQDLRWSL